MVERAAGGDDGHHARQILGRGVQIGRRNLRHPPLGRTASAGGRAAIEEGGLLDRVDGAEVRRGGGLAQLGDAVVFGLGQADPKVQIEQLGEVFAQGRPHRPPVDDAEQLARQITDRDRVIAGRRARRPQRRLGRQPVQHGLTVEPDGRFSPAVEAGQAGLVAHQLADGQLVLARRAEGGPVVGDPVLIGQQPFVHAARDHQGHDRLAGREDGDQRVLGEGFGPRQIG